MKIVDVTLETKNKPSTWIGPVMYPDFQENVIALQIELKLPEALVLRDALQHVMAAEAVVPGENNRKLLGSFYQLLNNVVKADRFMET